jgi:orotate phosphoribosyltransferase-like protein
MSVSVEVHDVEHVVIDDIVRSGSTVWRAIHITEADGRKVSITLYAKRDWTTFP